MNINQLPVVTGLVTALLCAAPASVGTGGGAMAIVLGRLVGAGRVHATDITEWSLTTTREYVKQEGLTNITVVFEKK